MITGWGIGSDREGMATIVSKGVPDQEHRRWPTGMSFGVHMNAESRPLDLRSDTLKSQHDLCGGRMENSMRSIRLHWWHRTWCMIEKPLSRGLTMVGRGRPNGGLHLRFPLSRLDRRQRSMYYLMMMYVYSQWFWWDVVEGMLHVSHLILGEVCDDHQLVIKHWAVQATDVAMLFVCLTPILPPWNHAIAEPKMKSEVRKPWCQYHGSEVRQVCDQNQITRLKRTRWLLHTHQHRPLHYILQSKRSPCWRTTCLERI